VLGLAAPSNPVSTKIDASGLRTEPKLPKSMEHFPS
jgi:hypothetical protein